MIAVANPRAQYASHRAEIDTAIRGVLDGGRYILGEEVARFEEEMAAYVGAVHGIGVGNGTDALQIALAAVGVAAGDEVITVSHTAVATVAAIENIGAVPVLADIDPHSFTIDPNRIAPLITPRTRAIVPVHLYGQPAELDPILEVARRHGLKVVEDCAQSHGASYRGARTGSFGDAASFSFYPTKNLGAIGDGGMVVTRDAAVATRARLLREYGWAERYVSHLRGWNTRLDELQAAILRIKLRFLDADNARRRRIAARYADEIEGVGHPSIREGCEHVFHLYVVRSPRRDALAAFLREQGVGTGVHYPVPVHQQPAYRGRLPGRENLAATESAANEILSLPMYPELPANEVDQVVRAVNGFEDR